MPVEGFLLVIAFAALPALGNFVGGAVAEVVSVSRPVLSLALHAAVGIVLGVVGLELMPEALNASTPWVPILAFVLGGGFFLGIDRLSGYLQARADPAGSSTSLAIFTGVSLDLFSDGVLVGTGTLINPTLGLLLAAGQVPADLPEGFAAGGSFQHAGMARWQRLLLSASFALPVLFGATLGYFALRGAPELLTLSVLAATGGALTAVALEEILPEAHQGEQEPRGAVLSLVAGFALFAAVSTYLTS